MHTDGHQFCKKKKNLMTQIWVCISCVTRHSTYISYPICQLIFFPCSFLYGDTSTPGNKHNCANLKLYASQQLYCVSLSIQDSYGRLFAKTKDIFRKFKGWRWRVKQWLTEEREKKEKASEWAGQRKGTERERGKTNRSHCCGLTVKSIQPLNSGFFSVLWLTCAWSR